MTPLRIAFITLLIGVSVGCGRDDSRAGIEISAAVPPGWHYVSMTTVRPAGSALRFDALELDHAIAVGQAAPLFALTSERPGSALTHAAVGINVQRGAHDANTSAGGVLDELLAASGEAVTVKQGVSATLVAGHAAAQAVLSDGGELEIVVVVVVFDGTVFTIAASLPLTSAQATRPAIEQFISTLAITRSR